MEWYYAHNGQQAGPVSQDELAGLFRNGTVKGTDLVWNESMTEWVPIGKVPAFKATRPNDFPPPVSASTNILIARPAYSTTDQFSPPTQPISALAIISLVLSLVGLFCCGVFLSIPAVVCGHIALLKIKSEPNTQGRGLAIAGLVIGYAGTIFWILYILFVGGLAFFEEMTKEMNSTQ